MEEARERPDLMVAAGEALEERREDDVIWEPE